MYFIDIKKFKSALYFLKALLKFIHNYNIYTTMVFDSIETIAYWNWFGRYVYLQWSTGSSVFPCL